MLSNNTYVACTHASSSLLTLCCCWRKPGDAALLSLEFSTKLVFIDPARSSIPEATCCWQRVAGNLLPETSSTYTEQHVGATCCCNIHSEGKKSRTLQQLLLQVPYIVVCIINAWRSCARGITLVIVLTLCVCVCVFRVCCL